MSTMRKDDLQELLKKREGPCVSLFMPTYKAGKQVEQNRIRFKNCLRKSEEQLLARDMRRTAVDDLLYSGFKLLDDGGYWRRLDCGLAAFLCGDGSRFFELPYQFDELVVVSHQFHLKPLIPLINDPGQFYVLALSKNSVRLLEGSRFEIEEVNLENVPSSLADALKFDYFERQLQFHTGTQSRGHKRDAVFFGSGAGDPDAKDAILRYFQQIDKGLRELLRDKQTPLVLAGVDYLFPIFREASKYQNLMEKGIPGNPEKISAAELHCKAWEIVEPHHQTNLTKAAERYHNLAGNEHKLASADIKTVLPAAAESRIETLFVALGVQRWGTFNQKSGAVTLHKENEMGDHDLLDFAAIQAFSSGADVYAMEPSKVPGGGPVAAVFRY